MKTNHLSKWKWQDIFRLYQIYGGQLRELQSTMKRIGINKPLGEEVKYLTKMHPDRAEIVSRAFFDAKRLNTQISILDREIGRRNGLVGVMG